MQTALVTGSSGFIGYHLCLYLLSEGFCVIGVDNMSDYYDVKIKQNRQKILLENNNFSILNDNIEKPDLMMNLFATEQPDIVVHLAAQAGVRHSIENPRSYMESNIIGTFEILEAARAHAPKHMLIASTSSAYGANTDMPYKEVVKADHQISFYAATKKATENMAHSYSHLYNLPITMFRFFTVYGPWGRPDMALFKFTKAILDRDPIDVYNYGNMKRDFTYVNDLVKAIRLLIKCIPQNTKISDIDSLSPVAPWRIVNIGNSKSIEIIQYIEAIEKATGLKSIRNLMPMQTGDVPSTLANNELLKKLTDYAPNTSVEEGVSEFVKWYKDYYNIR